MANRSEQLQATARVPTMTSIPSSPGAATPPSSEGTRGHIDAGGQLSPGGHINTGQDRTPAGQALDGATEQRSTPLWDQSDRAAATGEAPATAEAGQEPSSGTHLRPPPDEATRRGYNGVDQDADQTHQADDLTPPGGFLIEGLAASIRSMAPRADGSPVRRPWEDADTGRYMLDEQGQVQTVVVARPTAPPTAVSAQATADAMQAVAATSVVPVPLDAPNTASSSLPAGSSPSRSQPTARGWAVLGSLLVLAVGGYWLTADRATHPTGATLRLASTPAGAQVSIGGRPFGSTPLHLTSLDTGALRVVMSLPGYAPVTREFTLVAGDHNRFDVPLKRLPSAAPVRAEQAEAATPSSGRDKTSTRGAARTGGRAKASRDAPNRDSARRRPRRTRRVERRRARISEPSRATETRVRPRADKREDPPKETQALAKTPAKTVTPHPASAPAEPAPRQAIQQRHPVYPPAAERAGTEGWVRVRFRIDAEGRVIEPKVVEAQPEAVFDRAAVRAVRRWRYKPSNDPRSLATPQTVKVRFQLDR